ncbi:MAG TPA: DUF1801 domain-containing protein [Tenuifilaceae bacterium]|nr:DUF1801 domain-containing protein [Tenuifilaceae bacterium]HOZ15540.1 DUF1801 domain-containing protein [Tenuifilaceae bacterium]HPI46240.1 DUF1801 domain-containing protein [Tenuifilaceae bacterium]HPN22442.1 DUF1801 domain-containing protein [Tenuifilaceae bacterium]
MKITAETPEEYLSKISDEQRETVQKLREVVKDNLPKGFEETINYGMIGFIVPYSLYPKGYDCKPKQPLPFINIAAQKNHIALYHIGLYASPDLLNWFTTEFPKHSQNKLDMGKGCVRFKNNQEIPYELIGQLTQKVSVNDWIKTYENLRNKSK